MKHGCTWLICMTLGVLSVRAQEASRPVKVDRICGYLQQEKQYPDKRNSNSTQYGYASVGQAPVRLYPREGTEACCSQMSPAAEVLTRKNGKFNFRQLPAGNYWLVALIENREYKMQIEYKPTKENQSDCKELLYTLDKNGNFVLLAIITVT
jgi:hypothetical protein